MHLTAANDLPMFWWTSETMKARYPDGDYGFSLFKSPTHIFWLCLLVLLVAAAVIFFPRLSAKARHRTIVGLAMFMVASELIKDAVAIVTGQWAIECLPLHLCGVNIICCAWYAVRPTKFAAQVLYCLCIPGAFLAVLTPTWTRLPIWNIMHLHSETVHIALVLFPILLLLDGFKPRLSRVWQPIVYILVCCIPAFAVNALTFGNEGGPLRMTNFMFLSSNNENPILIVIESICGRPGDQIFDAGYIFGLLVLLMLVVTLLCLPWGIAEAVKKKRTAK